jgi:hypothetical protein
MLNGQRKGKWEFVNLKSAGIRNFTQGSRMAELEQDARTALLQHYSSKSTNETIILLTEAREPTLSGRGRTYECSLV